VLLFWDVMPAIGPRLERQEECPCMAEGTRPGLNPTRNPQAGDRGNKVPQKSTNPRNVGLKEFFS
jgi:hypothetical protein